MTLIQVLLYLALWVGATALLSLARPLHRASLADRVRPYLVTASRTRRRAGVLSVESFRDVIAPVAAQIGERLGAIVGVSEHLAVRLDRLHSPLDVAAFRLRQVGYGAAGLAAAVAVTLLARPPAALALAMTVGAPVGAFVAAELQLSQRSRDYQDRLFGELAVVSEQLGMLVTSGYSLGSALARLADRGSGVAAGDLGRVVARIRQGLSETEALREWASRSGVPVVDRLVSVLALNRETTDLGRLISEEARSIRRDAQRRLVETIERRGQMVWIPVTVATLVPGVIFLFIPFIDVMATLTRS